jgi:hypothetical protein
MEKVCTNSQVLSNHGWKKMERKHLKSREMSLYSTSSFVILPSSDYRGGVLDQPDPKPNIPRWELYILHLSSFLSRRAYAALHNRFGFNLACIWTEAILAFCCPRGFPPGHGVYWGYSWWSTQVGHAIHRSWNWADRSAVAVLVERLAFALVGFYAGAYLGLIGAQSFGVGGNAILLFAVSGLIGAVFAALIMDWVIIVLSCLVGAGAIVVSLSLDQMVALLVFVVLAAAGIFFQAKVMARSREG